MRYFIFGFHKAGTTFLKHLFEDVTRGSKTNHTHLDYSHYRKGMKKNNLIVCPVRYPSHLSKLGLSSDDCVIVQLRNPFDTLISEYYSFGFTHPRNGDDDEKGDIISVKFRRRDIKNNDMTLDEYCIKYSDHLLMRYENLWKILENCEYKVRVIYYSDMMNNFKKYSKELTTHLNMSDQKDGIVRRYSSQFSNFKPVNDKSIVNNKNKSHRRNGTPGEYTTKLKKETLDLLKEKFKDYYSNGEFNIPF